MQTASKTRSLTRFISMITALIILITSSVVSADENKSSALTLFNAIEKWKISRLFTPSENNDKKRVTGKS